MRFADGVYTSQETMKNIAFVLVKAGDTIVGRIPVEIYPDRVAVRKINLNPAAEPNPVLLAAADMYERIRSARVVQARSFEEVGNLQTKDKQKALEFAQVAVESLAKDFDALRADLTRLEARYKTEAPPGLFDPSETDLKALEGKTRELRQHITRLKEVIRIENDPAAIAARKQVEGLLLDAKTHASKADLDKAIEKYEEALKVAGADPAAKTEIERALEELKKLWEVKGDAHAAARKFIYETWPNLEKPADVQDALPAARRAFDACKVAGDRIGMMKMYITGPQVLERFAENLKQLADDAVDEEDRRKLGAYEKVRGDLEKLLNDVGKEIGADAAK
jgi:tetratricopeptide (TPR) repeat protein